MTEPSTTTQTRELEPQPTPRPWEVHPRWPNYVVPASDVAKLIGGADDEIVDREQFATPICDTRGNELSRFAHDKERVAQQAANAELIVAAVNAYSAPSDTEQRLREALERALMFFEQYKERHLVSAYFYAALADMRKAVK